MNEMSIKNNCLLIGLPESGKSTFIGAFWYAAESGEIGDTYYVKELPEDRAYLNLLKDNWLKCKIAPRTQLDQQHKISLKLYNKNTERLELNFPDVSGELYETHFEERKISMDFLDQLRSTDCVLLFINPSKLESACSIKDLLELYGIIDEEEDNEESLDPFTLKKIPTQVILVDLLQVIETFSKTPTKISIIISAWDTILDAASEEVSKTTPSKWIEKELPFLYQYLQANIERFEFFGVSAQGGKYDDNNEKLFAHLKQTDRIRVQMQEEISHDISLPIKWLINND